MTSRRFEIEGQPDFELETERKKSVAVITEVPDSDVADGLVFIIPGMGGEKDANYSAMLRRYISAKYNLIAVSVDGHCNTCRPARSTEFGEVGLEIEGESLLDAVSRYVISGEKIDRTLETHADILQMLQSASPKQFAVKALLNPPDGQYQNFGVLSALDHLRALNALIDSDLSFDEHNVHCVGSSHGGYIAHMMHKFAPNSFNGIIDASAYTETATAFIDGSWKEANITDGNLIYTCSTRQKWQFSNPGLPTFFGPDRSLIRDTAYDVHMKSVAAAAARKCQFRMIHSTIDAVSSPELKHRQAEILRDLGFDASLEMITSDAVDGKFIKSADHGMGIALNLLFDRYYPTIERRDGVTDRELETALTFDGPKYSYRISHQSSGMPLAATCEARSPLSGEAVDRLAS
ncbi:MAG: DUF2920 family protein [Parvibaculaceae bacterium]|nr:DUF2920 family protein [Parvibaculaceae bacterium]HBM90254.1 DUF2920 domain-containing protein [Rhodobiaceae bacterium]